MDSYLLNKPKNVVVSVSEPHLNIYEDLNEKLLEIRSKRDGVLLSHRDFKKGNDIYNKLIIYLSLFTAFFETVKAQLHLTERQDWVAPVSIIAPIFLSTFVSIISALLKFKKFPEKMEELIKASEKCNFTILRMRKLLENMSFQSQEVTKDTYNGEVMTYYREALDSIEKSMYPNKRSSYFEEAQKNLVTIHKNELTYNTNIHNIREKNVALEGKKLELTKKEQELFEIKKKNTSGTTTPVKNSSSLSTMFKTTIPPPPHSLSKSPSPPPSSPSSPPDNANIPKTNPVKETELDRVIRTSLNNEPSDENV